MHWATSFYLVLYGATLVVHVVFMNYVLGGTAFLAATSLRGRWRLQLAPDPMVEKARDWMPFALGAAITAGVAPLLFLQILYENPFYTANLLLLHRWMSIVPVLILGFYLLYVLKARPFERRVTPFVAVGAFLCIAWTGLAWTENHELSLDKENWVEFYASRSMWFRAPRVGVRFAAWLSGSVPMFAMLAGWQLLFAGRRGEAAPTAVVRRLARIAMGGLAVAALAGGTYGLSRDDLTRRALWNQAPGLGLAALGLLTQFGVWWRVNASGQLDVRRLLLLSAAALAMMGGTVWVREAIRISALAPLPAVQHDHAASVGGFWVFVFFLVLNAGLIAWSIRIGVRSSRLRSV